jgi:hypothetical protein
LLNKSKTWINQEFKGKKKGTKRKEILEKLLILNLELAEKEKQGIKNVSIQL